MKEKYLRMLKGMSKKGPRVWGVYLARCADGTLYTGVAKDIAARIEAHNCGRGAAYTRARRPVTIHCSYHGLTHSKALSLEAKIKTLPRARKEALTVLDAAAIKKISL